MLRTDAADRRPWAGRELADLLGAHDLAGLPQEPLDHDGWSGADLRGIGRGDEHFVLKRTSWERDWIVRATNDADLREAWAGSLFPVGSPWLPAELAGTCLGVARDGNGAALLMPDLGAELIPWERPERAGLNETTVERVLRAVAALHVGLASPPASWSAAPWCPWAERLLLLSPAAATRYQREANPVGDVFAAGWAAFDRLAPKGARRLVRELAADVSPLVEALGALPATVLHGDLKLSNTALVDDRVGLIDWEMVMLGPIAVELGWLLVSNVALLPEPPDVVLERYHGIVVGYGDPDVIGDWEAQSELAILVGLLLRGWRKGADAEAGVVHPTGISAVDDLSWWCRRALEVAEHRLR